MKECIKVRINYGFFFLLIILSLAVVFNSLDTADATLPCDSYGVSYLGCFINNHFFGIKTEKKKEYHLFANPDIRQGCFDITQHEGNVVYWRNVEIRRCRPNKEVEKCPEIKEVRGSCYPISIQGCAINGVFFLSSINFNDLRVEVDKTPPKYYYEPQLTYCTIDKDSKNIKDKMLQYDGKVLSFNDIKETPDRIVQKVKIEKKGYIEYVMKINLPESEPVVIGDCNIEPGSPLYWRVTEYIRYMIEKALKNGKNNEALRYETFGEKYLTHSSSKESGCSFYSSIKYSYMKYKRYEEALNVAYKHDKCKGKTDELEKLGDELKIRKMKKSAIKAYEKAMEIETDEQVRKRLEEKMKK
ncbi:MAG: hypothetical protein N3A62_10135 [Thermodesulfovibrionales bacterium]|nr:hypothetical protein [Thermodesulfovibrionales bacterium]